MGVGKNDRVELPVVERPKIRQRFFPFLFRMHPRIQDEPLARRLEVITIGADFRAASEIDKLQIPLFLFLFLFLLLSLLLLLLLPARVTRRILLYPSIETIDKAHQHRHHFHQRLFARPNYLLINQSFCSKNIETGGTFQGGAARDV
jgi:hypothetical protein